MSFPEAARCACPGYKVLLNRQLQNPDFSGFFITFVTSSPRPSPF
ncbi:hypothetical protein SB6422_04197 [Klebsiella huaxiensis]|uniref:Uncharacterized protein n=1 Tax=Klebsiella huaxiensis TaxID=2153354 RepID=A0A564HEG7_9ENTR|nr:hypothetical protein SB6422_04197 [Klebsiella huaxiensis]